MLGLLSEVQDPTIDRVALSVIEGLLELETPPFYLGDAVLAREAQSSDSTSNTRSK